MGEKDDGKTGGIHHGRNLTDAYDTQPARGKRQGGCCGYGADVSAAKAVLEFVPELASLIHLISPTLDEAAPRARLPCILRNML